MKLAPTVAVLLLLLLLGSMLFGSPSGDISQAQTVPSRTPTPGLAPQEYLPSVFDESDLHSP